MNRIVIVTYLYKRLKLAKSMMDYFAQFPFVEKIAIGSEGEESRTVAESSGWNYHETPNDPLGAKWNLGFELTRDIDYDYFLLMPSDDFICRKTLDFYFNHAVKDYYEFSDLFFLEPAKNKALFLAQTTNIGAGRLIHKKLIEAAEYRCVSPFINRGFDGCVKLTTLSHAETFENIGYQSHGFVGLDVKTDTNIWAYSILEADSRAVPLNADWLRSMIAREISETASCAK